MFLYHLKEYLSQAETIFFLNQFFGQTDERAREHLSGEHLDSMLGETGLQ